MAAKKVDLNEVGVQLGNVRREMHLALSELSVDIQQHGEVRDRTKEMLEGAQKSLNDMVKAALSGEVPDPVDQNQPVPGQASVPDVSSQP